MTAFCRLLLLVLLAASSVAAQPTLHTTFAGFTDVNGNGVLDCGEPFTVLATFATNNSGTPALSGTLTLPTTGSSGLVFLPGSVVIDPDLTNGCSGTITRGNSPEDPSATLTFSCPADPIDSNSWTLVASYRALATSTSALLAATAQAATTDGATYQDTLTHALGTPCTGAANSLSLTKTSAGSGLPGSVLVSTLTAHDLSGLGAGGIQFVETIPALTTFDGAASSPGWTCDGSGGPGSVCRLPAGNVPPNGSLSAFLAVTLDASFPAGTTAIVNTACVRVGPVTVAACATSTTPTSGAGILHLAKTVKSGSGAPGATLVYLLTATNSGNQGLAQVSLTETVPVATIFNSGASDSGWSCTPNGSPGASCTLTLGALAAGSSAARNFAVTVDDPLAAGTTAITNAACSHDPAAADACDTAIVPTSGAPLLKLTKALTSGSGTPGSTLVYGLTILNSGSEGASAVVLTETPPNGTVFAPLASSPGWSCSGSPLVCGLAVGALAAGASVVESFAITLPATFPAGLAAWTNTACAASPGDVGPSCATLIVPAAGRAALELAKSYTGGPLAPGLLLPYQLTVSNTGNQDASTVVVTEVVPAHTRFAAGSSAPGWGCAPSPAAASTCQLTLGALAAGTSATVAFALTADDPLPAGLLTIANSACARDAAGDQGCGSVGTPAPVGLVATLRDAIGSDSTPVAHPGDVIDYTLAVANPSAAAATEIVVASELDPRLTLEVGSVTTSSGTVTEGNTVGATQPVVAIPSLGAGALATITFRARLATALPPDLRQVASQSTLNGTNFASTVSDDPDTPAPLDPTATPIAAAAAPPVAPIPVLGGPGLALLVVALATVAWPLIRRQPRRRDRKSSRPASVERREP